MVILEFRNVELDFCLDCRGCWLDRGELALILHGRLETPDDWKLEAGRKSRRRCPRCAGRLREGRLPGTTVDVDLCERNDGIWLDKGELQEIARARASGGRAALISEFCAEVFGQRDKNTTSGG